MSHYTIGLCSECKKDKPIVNKHFKLCHFHNQKRIRQSKPAKESKKDKWTTSPSTLCRKKKKEKNSTVTYRRKPTGELAFMKGIWERTPVSIRRCTECGKKLVYFSPTWMAHIIAKSVSPHFRLDERNIILLCEAHHTQLDKGEKSKMKIFEYTEKVRQELNLEYYERH